MLLTALQSTAIITTPLTHSKDGICSPKLGDNTPLSKVVFFCPSKLSTGLIRIKSFMVGCIEQPFIRLTVPLFGTANLIQSTSRKFAVLRGGLFSKQGINHMNTHAQSQLIEYSLLIGSIAESNPSLTACVLKVIENSGKPLDDMSVSEFITIIKANIKAFNRA